MSQFEGDSRLRQWFDYVDTNRNGTLDAEELRLALGRSGLDFPPSTCHMLLRMHDMDRSQTIDFREFCYIHNFLLSVRASFLHFDRDGSKTLTADELQQALASNGFQLSREAFTSVLFGFDTHKTGRLGLPDFVSLAAYLTAARGVFGTFDRQQQGSANINFDQFCWMLGNLR